MELNAARIKVLQAQEDIVSEMRENTCKTLLRVTKDTNVYRKILKGLIVQVRSVYSIAYHLAASEHSE
jgi:V-type H+-transporting ATPase subunit E